MRAQSLEVIARRIVTRAEKFLKEEGALDDELNAARDAAATADDQGYGPEEILEEEEEEAGEDGGANHDGGNC